MRVSAASSHILNESSLGRLSADLAIASKEVTSGKRADLGLALGDNVARVSLLRQEMQALDSITTTNGLLAARLDTMQGALASVGDVAQRALAEVVVGAETVGGDRLAHLARSQLDELGTHLNAAQDGMSLFAATNASGPAFLGSGDVGAQPLSKVVDAFVAHFGFQPDDPAALGISKAQMSTFLATSFAQLFVDPDWSSDWSGVGATPQQARIAPEEVVSVNVDANAEPVRRLTGGLALLAALGGGSFSGDARQALMTEARDRIGASSRGLDEMRADLGRIQERVSAASERMSVAKSVLVEAESKWTEVDPAEASLRFNNLVQQLEASYAITRRLSELTLLKAL